MNNKLSRSGFTLLEVLIALLILVLGLVSIFSLLGIGAQSHHRGISDVIIASYAATVLSEVQDEFMRGVPLQNLRGQTHPDFPSNFKYDISFQPLNGPVADAEGEPRQRREAKETLVTIMIKWPSGPGLESEKFQTVLTR